MTQEKISGPDASAKGKPHPQHKSYSIKIDRDPFKVESGTITGAELRALPTPPVGPDRDLFLEISGPGQDKLIGDNEVVTLHEGAHFITIPRNVTPGSVRHGGV
jgi:hypothetical protein